MPDSDRALSNKQFQVAYLYAQGRSKKSIAYQMHISTRMVRVHLERAYSKLNILTRMELVKAWEKGAF